MKEKGVTEGMGSGRLGPGAPPLAKHGTSPFKDNCPEIGTKIIFISTGHAVACKLKNCDPKTGEASLSCQESNFKQPVKESGQKHDLTIDKDGKLSDPGWSTNGGDALGWIKIIHY